MLAADYYPNRRVTTPEIPIMRSKTALPVDGMGRFLICVSIPSFMINLESNIAANMFMQSLLPRTSVMAPITVMSLIIKSVI
jgi:hypothetical protein